MSDSATGSTGNAANGVMGVVAAIYTWVVGNLDNINHGITTLAGIGGIVVVYISIRRAMIGWDREGRANEAEKQAEKQQQGVYLMDKPATTSPVQPPPSKPDPTYYPPDSEL